MARLLRPQDFGLVAMVTSITSFVGLFKDLGLSNATVQRPHITASVADAYRTVAIPHGNQFVCVIRVWRKRNIHKPELESLENTVPKNVTRHRKDCLKDASSLRLYQSYLPFD
jgi:hypothetical protein